MRLSSLRPLVRANGGFASVYLDVSRDSEAADHRLRLRWRSVAGDLRDGVAPVDLIDAPLQGLASVFGVLGGATCLDGNL